MKLPQIGAALASLLLAAAPAALAQNRPAAATTATTLTELGETLYPGVEYPEALDRAAVHRATTGGLPFESKGVWGMSPHATPEIIQKAIALSHVPAFDGPVKETWQSVADNYDGMPDWMYDGKFGIFLHFGLYSVAAHHNEWYQKHMYGTGGIRNWHIQNFGPLDVFGYKDFIPKFTLAGFDADAWVKLFEEGGAKYFMPTVEHHDGFSLWDSKVSKFNSVQMGPKRDFAAEIAKAARARNMKFGLTNHHIEHYDFIEPEKIPSDMKTDLTDPEWRDFYWTDHSDERMAQHLAVWLDKNVELIDQYQPDLLWFDNGINNRMFDPLKLKIAAYYYNKAAAAKQDVTLTGKGTSWIAGGVQDFEGMGRAPKEVTDYRWFVHDKINARSWGYVDGDETRSPQSIVNTLVDVVSRNGVFALNLSPMGDGSIPQAQQDCLRAIGKWLSVNGEAVYGSRPWTKAGEGRDIRFTTKAGALYVFVRTWPAEGAQVVVTSLPEGGPAGKATAVSMLDGAAVAYEQGPGGLALSPAGAPPTDGPAVFKVEGLAL